MGFRYGNCNRCGGNLYPIWFEEKEDKKINGSLVYTGIIRKACFHLVCEHCDKNECVDDSFDGQWH